MTARSIRIPDAAHPIAVTRNPSRVVVTVAAISGVPGGPATSARVTVSYPYRDNQLLPTLPVLDASRWMPAQLTSQAMVAIQS